MPLDLAKIYAATPLPKRLNPLQMMQLSESARKSGRERLQQEIVGHHAGDPRATSAALAKYGFGEQSRAMAATADTAEDRALAEQQRVWGTVYKVLSTVTVAEQQAEEAGRDVEMVGRNAWETAVKGLADTWRGEGESPIAAFKYEDRDMIMMKALALSEQGTDNKNLRLSDGTLWNLEEDTVSAPASKVMWDVENKLPRLTTNAEQQANPERFVAFAIQPPDTQGNQWASTGVGMVQIMAYGVPLYPAPGEAQQEGPEPGPDPEPGPAVARMAAEEAAEAGVGFLAKLEAGWSRFWGGFTPGEVFSTTRQARTFLRTLNQDLKTTFVNNPKFPQAEMETVAGFLVTPDDWFEDPDYAVRQMGDLRDWLEEKQAANTMSIDSGKLSPGQKEELEGQNEDIRRGLYLMGPPPEPELGNFGEMTVDELLAIDPRGMPPNQLQDYIDAIDALRREE